MKIMSLVLAKTDALILCGGIGSRLKKISGALPKPMVKIGNDPFLVLLIKHLHGLGLRRFILSAGYKSEVIKDYFTANKIDDVNICFSCERERLGTGGAVKKVKMLIKSNPFFVFNGDSICQFNLGEFLNFHKEKRAIISMLLTRIKDAGDFGKVILGDSSEIISFQEKGSRGFGLINAGVYLFEKEVFSLMPAALKFSLEDDFFSLITGERIFGFKGAANFIDIGTPSRFRKAELKLKKILGPKIIGRKYV